MESRDQVRLADIARIAGCSINTVSLALRDSPRISDKRKAQIKGIAEKLGYVPNRAARNLRAKKSKMVGIYTTPLVDDVRIKMVNTLLDELHRGGYSPILGVGRGERWYKTTWIRTFRELNVEMIVVLWDTPSVPLPEWAEKIPLVFIGCLPTRNINCDYLALDREEAGKMAVEYLISCGCRRLTVIRGGVGFGRGALSIIRDRGLEYVEFSDANSNDMQEVYKLGHLLYQKRDSIDGLACGDARIAAYIMKGFIDAGGRVPDDITFVAYDYFPWADVLPGPLATVEQPIDSMASVAMSIIKRRLEEPFLPKMQLLQPHRLVVRGSFKM